MVYWIWTWRVHYVTSVEQEPVCLSVFEILFLCCSQQPITGIYQVKVFLLLNLRQNRSIEKGLCALPFDCNGQSYSHLNGRWYTYNQKRKSRISLKQMRRTLTTLAPYGGSRPVEDPLQNKHPAGACSANVCLELETEYSAHPMSAAS